MSICSSPLLPAEDHCRSKQPLRRSDATDSRNGEVTDNDSVASSLSANTEEGSSTERKKQKQKGGVNRRRLIKPKTRERQRGEQRQEEGLPHIGGPGLGVLGGRGPLGVCMGDMWLQGICCMCVGEVWGWLGGLCWGRVQRLPGVCVVAGWG